MRHVTVFAAVLLIMFGVAPAERAFGEDGEFVIVQYGSVLVKTTDYGAKVMVGDLLKASVNNVIDSVPIGTHTVTCTFGDKSVSGSFTVKKGELLRLEARFAEGVLLDSGEAERAEAARKKAEEQQKKAELAKKEDQAKKEEQAKKEAEQKKREIEQKKAEATEHKAEPKTVMDMKKTVVREDSKKTEPSAQNLFRDLHLTQIRVTIETEAAEVRVNARLNQKASKFTENKNESGQYYRTKQGVLLCESGPCEKTWSGSFVYTDENGKNDAILLRWTETIFNGITPNGTSRRDLEWCLNGTCKKLADATLSDNVREFVMDRYRIEWSRPLILIRRLDVIKDISESGASVAEYQ